MWKQILEVAARFWKVAEETQRNSTAIRELRQEVDDMGRVFGSSALRATAAKGK